MENLFGLPAHPLLVHIPVVLTPLAAAGAVAVALRPAWRERLGWLVVALAAVALVGSHFAIESGDALEDLVRETALVEDHEDVARLARPAALLLFVAVLGLVAFDAYRRRRALTAGPGTAAQAKGQRVAAAIAAAVVVSAVLAVAGVVQAGHSGARAVWDDSENPRLEQSHDD